jgi:hypothetical protein
MPLSTGFNHVATVTADLDRVVRFYRTVSPVLVPRGTTRGRSVCVASPLDKLVCR